MKAAASAWPSGACSPCAGSLINVSELARAVHYVFTVAEAPSEIGLRKVLSLAKAFQGIEPDS